VAKVLSFSRREGGEGEKVGEIFEVKVEPFYLELDEGTVLENNTLYEHIMKAYM